MSDQVSNHSQNSISRSIDIPNNNLPDGNFKLHILTLNCWGLWLGAKKRRQRIAGIVRYLKENNCDIVFLQEVWVTSDFEIIRDGTKDIYRFAHLYRAGSVLGSSGIVILCKWLPKVIHFEPYSLNGSPFYPWHGDWFAGKGIAYSRVDLDGLSLHLFSTHTHAYYKENEPVHDQYSVHRVCQSYQLARFINFISDTACNRKAHGKDLIIVAGDMNSTSSELPYQILTTMAGLVDCLTDDDVTYCHPNNSFTTRTLNSIRRIDFILCRLLGEGQCVVDQLSSISKDPIMECSLSDHEPVMAELRIEHGKEISKIEELSHSKCKIQVLDSTRDILKQYHQYNIMSKRKLFYVVLLMFIITLPSATYYARENALIPISTLVLVWFAASFMLAVGLTIGFLCYRFEQGAIEVIMDDIARKTSDIEDTLM